MRRLAAFSLLLIAMGGAAPAAAQIVGKPDYGHVPAPNPFLGDSRLPGPGVGRDVRDIRDRVDRARDNGTLSRREARRLDRQARQIGQLARRYGRDGLSPWEKNELEARARYLRDAVNRPRRAGG